MGLFALSGMAIVVAVALRLIAPAILPALYVSAATAAPDELAAASLEIAIAVAGLVFLAALLLSLRMDGGRAAIERDAYLIGEGATAVWRVVLSPLLVLWSLIELASCVGG